MSMAARIQTEELAPNRRSAVRRHLTLRLPGSVLDNPASEAAEAAGVAVLIHDLSRSGLLIETSADLETGASLTVELPEAGPTEATVMWRDGTLFGCRFAHHIPISALSAAQLMNPAGDPQVSSPGNNLFVTHDDDSLPVGQRLRVICALALGAWVVALVPLVAVARVLG